MINTPEKVFTNFYHSEGGWMELEIVKKWVLAMGENGKLFYLFCFVGHLKITFITFYILIIKF